MRNKERLNPYRYSPTFSIGSKSYISTEQGWMEIPRKTKSGLGKVEEFQVISDKVENFFTVKNNNGNWSCTCSEFSFHKKCCHIEDTKNSFYPKF